MKYSIAILALLGLMSQEKVNAVQYMGHKKRLDFLNLLINNDESESESDSSDEELVQGDYSEMPAIMDGHDTGYSRNMPSRFSEERDDRLMNSMVGAYAREIFHDGKPTGHLFLNKADARAAADEVIRDHPHEDRLQDGADYDGDRFEDTWNHFDVNKDGLVEVERMPQFMRMLLGNALAIDLQ